MENFYTLLSNTGINAIIAARASNSEVKLTKIAVGDGDIIPSQDMTALKSEKHRFNINSIIQDIDNPNYLIIEGVIPSNIGGFYVSEVAIYTDQNTLFAIGSLPKTYKPLLEEGSAKDLTIKIFLEITNADSVTLKVDDSVVLATRKFVLSELKKYAFINGDETKRFKVADAVEPNEAISKKQFDDNKFNINTLTDKPTPIDTDNLGIQETDGTLKKLSWSNLKATLLTYFSLGFAVRLASNGYIKLPNWLSGLIIQWGLTPATSATTYNRFTFPIAFPTACLQAFTGGGTGNSAAGSITAFTATEATVYANSGVNGQPYRYFAIGY